MPLVVYLANKSRLSDKQKYKYAPLLIPFEKYSVVIYKLPNKK